MDLKKIAVRICIGVLVCIGYGYSSQFYYKVIFDAAGDNGRIMISTDATEIENSTTCSGTNCAIVEINGSKLSEYLMACINKMYYSLGTSFTLDGTKYKFTFYSGNHCLNYIYFYEEEISGVKVTTIEIQRKKDQEIGKIVLPLDADRVQQRKVDYMVSILIEAIEPKVEIADGLGNTYETYINFHKTTDNVITDLYTWTE